MSPSPIAVAIVGGGLSGLCLANGLLDDPAQRFSVAVYERDDLAFTSERGGYQIRLGQDGIDGLKECLDQSTYDELKSTWGAELSRAPVLLEPRSMKPIQRLNDLKHYPKSRAVPRQVLKDFLLRRPTEKKALHLGHKLVRVETRPSSTPGESVVSLQFDDGSTEECDILIAADGASSTVNRLMGLNNTIITSDARVTQGRCSVSREVYDQLPPLLRESGSILFINGDFLGFSAVYEGSAKDKKDTGAFVFWGIQVPPSENERIEQAQEKAHEVAQIMEELGCEPNGLPKIARLATNNVKIGKITSSKEPGDWRKGDAKLGRIVFIGDAIHPMTPGRGQGANQAMKDAGVLNRRFYDLASKDSTTSRSDAELLTWAKDYDKEMYSRAFPWVKASQQAFSINTSTRSGYYIVRAAFAAMRAWGLVTSMLEMLRIKKVKPDVAF